MGVAAVQGDEELVSRIKSGDTQSFDESRCQFIKMLAPFAPYITEEIWHQLGRQGSIHHAEWPAKTSLQMVDTKINIPVQVNGKVRDRIQVPSDIVDTSLKFAAMKSRSIKAAIGNHQVKRVIVVPRRVVNIVVD